MDSITQAVLGAAFGQTVAGRKIGHKASLIGAILGTLPDLDVILVPLYDSVERLTIHRGLSHSFLFTGLLAILLAWLFSRKWKEMSFTHWLFLTAATLITHPLLDACTSYGTLLLLPFSDARVAWDNIAIVDPVYTLPMLIGLVFGFFKSIKTHRAAMVGLILSHLYMGLTFVNHAYVVSVVEDTLAEQQIENNRMTVVPGSAGNMLWHAVAQNDSAMYIGEYSLLDEDKVIDFRTYPRNTSLLNRVNDEEMKDVLIWFADGFYTVREKDGSLLLYNLKCDMQGETDGGEAPTLFYFKLTPEGDNWQMEVQMHDKNPNGGNSVKARWDRMWGE